MSSSSPVTTWIERLKLGDDQAAEELWRVYYGKLVRLARLKLAGAKRRIADEEDIALTAFDSFCRGVRKGHFPRLTGRNDLWQVLVMVTARKAVDQKKLERRAKRGGGRVRGESVFQHVDRTGAGLGDIIGRKPTPEFAALFAEELELLLRRLDDDGLRKLVLMKLEGYLNTDIAEHLGCGLRTVERKLSRIRAIYRDEENR